MYLFCFLSLIICINVFNCSQLKTFSQKSYICNSVELVEKLKNVNISENTIISSFDVVSMCSNINVAESEKLLENKINENFSNRIRLRRFNDLG